MTIQTGPKVSKLWIHGFDGRMGQTIRKLLLDDPHFDLVGGSSETRVYLSEAGSKQEQFRIETCSHEHWVNGMSPAELMIDFSSAEGSSKLCHVLKQHKLGQRSILIGSTGLSERIVQDWLKYAKDFSSKVLIAPNTSLGIYLLVKLSQQAASMLRPMDFDIEIVESHHRHKKDAPSGTAKFIAEVLADQEKLEPCWNRSGLRQENEIGIAVLRGGSVFGEHEVKFMGELEELSITHRALSRQLFAEGALKLADWVSRAEGTGKVFRLIDIPIEDMGRL